MTERQTHYRPADDQYLDIAEQILLEGEPTDDRTGVGTLELFGEPQMTFDMRDGLPLLTTKKVYYRSVISELTWMLKGRRDLEYLTERGNRIWDEWPFVNYLHRTGQAVPEQGSEEWNLAMSAYRERILADPEFSEKHGDLGPVYGYQWRQWPGKDGEPIDQLGQVETRLREQNRKYGRRLIVSAWNVAQLEDMALPACHAFFQFNSSNQIDPETNKNYLDMKMYQRSADWFLGVPFNMAQYALLLHAMAQTTDHTARKFIHTFGSAHIYKNHTEQMQQQRGRQNALFAPAQLELNPDIKDIGQFEPNDFHIIGHQSHPAIKAQVAI